MGYVGHTPQIPVSAVKVVVKSSPKQGTAALEPHKLVLRDFSPRCLCHFHHSYKMIILLLTTLYSLGFLCLSCRRPRFDPWVWKIPRRRKWQLIPVFLPGKSHG